MTRFTPNPIAVKEAADKLTAKQPGGGFTPLEDCMLIAYNKAFDGLMFAQDYKENNQYKFWMAVHAYLDAKRKGQGND